MAMAMASTASEKTNQGAFLRSYLGKQFNSCKESAPSFGFGSQERSGGATMATHRSPGPMYLPSPRGSIGDGAKCVHATACILRSMRSVATHPRADVLCTGSRWVATVRQDRRLELDQAQDREATSFRARLARRKPTRAAKTLLGTAGARVGETRRQPGAASL